MPDPAEVDKDLRKDKTSSGSKKQSPTPPSETVKEKQDRKGSSQKPGHQSPIKEDAKEVSAVKRLRKKVEEVKKKKGADQELDDHGEDKEKQGRVWAGLDRKTGLQLTLLE